MIRKSAIPDLFGNYHIEPIHYLTWHQPFASLMLHGKKETRPAITCVRGTVLILASQNAYIEPVLRDMCGDRLLSLINETLKNEPTRDLRGMAIAIANLTGCRAMTQADEKTCFVRWMPGKYIWEFTDVKRIKPFHMKGKQGWGILSDYKILNQIEII